MKKTYARGDYESLHKHLRCIIIIGNLYVRGNIRIFQDRWQQFDTMSFMFCQADCIVIPFYFYQEFML